MTIDVSSPPLAKIQVLTPVSIVVPTFREAANIPTLLERIDAVRRQWGLDVEVLFLDDRSADGSVEAVARAGFDWARIIVRDGPRGLSPAVVDGLRLARSPVIVDSNTDIAMRFAEDGYLAKQSPRWYSEMLSRCCWP